ncbi:MAG: hypothetical protein WKG00_19085 [Polyangiaceae bacterium]
MRVLLRAARIIVSRHRFPFAIGAALLAVVALWLSRPRRGSWTEPYAGADMGPDDALQPRAVLSRVWFDKVTKDPHQVTNMWLFFGGGCAVHEEGTWLRWTTEVFEHGRQDDRIVIDALQDNVATPTAFHVERCNHLPFDLCLTFDTPGRGPKTLYGFSRRADLSAHAPLGGRFLASAHERAPCSWYD